MPVQYSVIIKMGCGKKIAAAVHIDIIVFYFSKQYNEDKKGVCFYEVSEICRENGLKAGCVACAVRIRSDLPSVNVSSFAIGALILYILGCCIYCVFQSLWLQLGLLVGIGLAVYAVLFLFVLFQEIGEHIKENLRDFIFS